MKSCAPPPEAPPDFEAARKKEPLNEIYNARYFYHEGTRLRAVLEVPYVVERLEGEETLTFLERGVKIQFFDSAGREDSRLTARRAIMYNKRDYAEAAENVVVVNQKNERLETERLRWHRRTNLISTDAWVKVSTPEEVVYGDSLVADASFNVWRIYKPRGRVKINE
jgi:hypothetical protein